MATRKRNRFGVTAPVDSNDPLAGIENEGLEGIDPGVDPDELRRAEDLALVEPPVRPRGPLELDEATVATRGVAAPEMARDASPEEVIQAQVDEAAPEEMPVQELSQDTDRVLAEALAPGSNPGADDAVNKFVDEKQAPKPEAPKVAGRNWYGEPRRWMQPSYGMDAERFQGQAPPDLSQGLTKEDNLELAMTAGGDLAAGLDEAVRRGRMSKWAQLQGREVSPSALRRSTDALRRGILQRPGERRQAALAEWQARRAQQQQATELAKLDPDSSINRRFQQSVGPMLFRQLKAQGYSDEQAHGAISQLTVDKGPSVVNAMRQGFAAAEKVRTEDRDRAESLSGAKLAAKELGVQLPKDISAEGAWELIKQKQLDKRATEHAQAMLGREDRAAGRAKALEDRREEVALSKEDRQEVAEAFKNTTKANIPQQKVSMQAVRDSLGKLDVSEGFSPRVRALLAEVENNPNFLVRFLKGTQKQSLTPEEQAFIQSFANMKNAITKAQAGSAVSASEGARINEALGSDWAASPEGITRALDMYEQAVLSEEAGYLNALTDEQLNMYHARSERGATSPQPRPQPRHRPTDSSTRKAPSTSNMVRVVHPDGRTGEIPKSRLQAALDAGFKVQ